jgi:hypothetical protein
MFAGALFGLLPAVLLFSNLAQGGGTHMEVGRIYESALTPSRNTAPWSFSPERGSCVTVTMTSRSFPPALSVSRGTPDRDAEVARDNNESRDGTVILALDSVSDSTYYVRATSAEPISSSAQYAITVRRVAC